MGGGSARRIIFLNYFEFSLLIFSIFNSFLNFDFF
jgi:hypothetical protein